MITSLSEEQKTWVESWVAERADIYTWAKKGAIRWGNRSMWDNDSDGVVHDTLMVMARKPQLRTEGFFFFKLMRCLTRKSRTSRPWSLHEDQVPTVEDEDPYDIPPAIRMRYVESLTVSQIAKRLSCSTRQVDWLIKTQREQLCTSP